jgi:Xaa-Pro aminopeptidase
MPNTITETTSETRFNLAAIQHALRENKIDGWLFYDHHHRDPLAYSILGLDPNIHVTRRWYYFIPATGEPKKLVHRIESFRLDTLPGTKTAYSSWQELESQLATLLIGATRIAMQYSPRNAIMYVSMVDAGTIELLRDLGKQIVSSADLVSQFEAVLTDEQLATHYIAQKKIDQILDAAWKEIGSRARNGGTDEHAMVQYLQQAMSRENLVCEPGPHVSAGPNSADSHYEPTAAAPPHRQKATSSSSTSGANSPTTTAVAVRHHRTGSSPQPTGAATHLHTVRDARDASVKAVRSLPPTSHRRMAGRRRLTSPIRKAGFGDWFTHRTGHNIGPSSTATARVWTTSWTPRQAPHPPQHLLLCRTRPLLPREFGVRSEVDMIPAKAKPRSPAASRPNSSEPDSRPNCYH